MFIPWRRKILQADHHDPFDLDSQATEDLCPLLAKQASSPFPHSQLLALRSIIHLSTTRNKWDRDQLIAFFDEETVASWKRDDELYTDEWLDAFEQARFCLTRNPIVEAVDQIERYQKLSLRIKATSAINALLDFCQEDANEVEKCVAIRFYVNAVWNTPLDIVEYYANFSNLAQVILSRIESRISQKKEIRECVEEANALLFHQFLRALWTGGINHVDEVGTWEVAFELIETCRSVPSRFSNAYFYAGNDWNALLLGAIAENPPRSVPLHQILLKSAPIKHEGYDSFLEKKFPFPPDSKVNWPSTRKINNRGKLIKDD